MTRQEAIDHLKEDIYAYVLCGSAKEVNEMAIEALMRWEGAENILDKVLEIIAIRKSSVAYDKSKDYKLACDAIEHGVLKLRGGKE